MTVWRLITHHIKEHKEDMLRWVENSQRLALGWGDIGDLNGGHHTSPDTIRDAIVRAYRGNGNAASGGQSLWDLWHTMARGDLVIVSTGRRRALVMRVVGPYQFAPRRPGPMLEGYQHQRETELTDIKPDPLWTRVERMAPGNNVYSPLVPCRVKLPSNFRG